MAEEQENSNTELPQEIQEIIPLVELTDKERENFFKAFLSDSQYVGEEVIFDGQMTIKFRTLSTDETMEIYDQMRDDQISGRLTSDANYLTKLTSYKLGASLMSANNVLFMPEVIRENFPVHTDKFEKENYLTKRSKQITSWPNFKFAGYIEAYRIFENKVLQLTKEIQTENFWKAVKLSS